MKRYIVFLIPLVLILGGIYIVAFTPDVVTQTVEYAHSHNYAVVLFLLGLLAFLAALAVAVVE